MVWKSSWRDADQLPTAIRLTVRDSVSQRVLSVSTVAPVHVQASAECMQSPKDCSSKADEAKDRQDGERSNGPNSGGGTL
jgi:general secretion pathway protein J